MTEKVIEFISKTYVRGKSSRSVLRTLAIVFFILYILILIFQVVMDGFSASIITKNIIPLLLFAYVMNSTKEVAGYKAIVAKVVLGDQKISIIYENVDREDKMGPRNEEIKIKFDNITKVEYSNELRCLNIQGYPIEKVVYQKQNPKKEYIKNNEESKKEKRTLLYVDGNEKNEIINHLRNKAYKETIMLN